MADNLGFMDMSPSTFNAGTSVMDAFGAGGGIGGASISPFPTTPNPTAGPLQSLAPPNTFAQNYLGTGPLNNKVFGLPTDMFIQAAGQLAQAIGPGTIGGNLGQLASSIGKAKMLADAAKEQDKVNKAFLEKVLTKHNGSLSAALADPSFDSNVLTNSPHMSLLSLLGSDGILNKTPSELGLSLNSVTGGK